MSLLMEALRKAEAAKRAGHGATPPEQESESLPERSEAPAQPSPDSGVPDVFKFTTSDDLVALAPREDSPTATPSVGVLEDFPAPASNPSPGTMDDVLDDYLTAKPDQELEEETELGTRERTKAVELRERAAAASMFNAKSAGGKTLSRTRVQVLTISMVLIAGIVAGAWAYLSTQTNVSGVGVNQSLANFKLKERGFIGENTPAPAKVTATLAPTPATASTSTLPDQAAAKTPPVAALPNPTTGGQATTTVPVKTAAAASTPPAQAPVAQSTVGQSQSGAEAATRSAPPPRLAVTDPQRAAVNDPDPVGSASDNARPAAVASTNEATAFAQAASTRTLEIIRSNTANKIRPELQSAYSQLQRGNLKEAEDLYQDLAIRFPNNRDALLGLASSKMQLGKKEEARSHYEHLLKLNPKDALARTGMLQSLPSTDPARYEQELLSLRTQFPDLAPLSFALGNHYAQTNRWHEAQSAYFEAMVQAKREGSAPVSPDYAYNLAVSLEQLGQQRAALEYYKQAETLAVTVKPGFDPMMLRQRLVALGQQQ